MSSEGTAERHRSLVEASLSWAILLRQVLPISHFIVDTIAYALGNVDLDFGFNVGSHLLPACVYSN